ncbi:alpha/beta hydrolase [Halogeometricum borinquense DSM 11551]|uniref:Alpha/beta hydrolase n=1 Tax=Halogeometricum borinquense (strain ATCC 700274 / DSM 11551 / JCM 10706 / KCTC 4070 / PR3) TaxID=469382 RepID=E4NPQ1_HALBP|nr:alpha/beta family hydrolase [Halogeometricum borinquense]ADQ66534.1 predicted hydrolase of the alpha/beta superfamily [Halogeometricum borinquense DSM 11551]ELY31009.1 alpha/beta hydrolase [Halogeometricum borinquense DSM 11551]
MTETVLIPGGRDVRGTLDAADDGINDCSEGDKTSTDTVVIACPPHPQHRGHRGDDRLVAVSEELNRRGIDCLRFDYGAWDEGYGERADTLRAVEWASEQYDRVALFGFSFGGAMALLAAVEGADAAAVSALAPAHKLADDLDVVAAFPEIPVPVQVVYGTRDDVADAERVAARAREFEQSVVALEADHFFVGQHGKVAETVSDFLTSWL